MPHRGFSIAPQIRQYTTAEMVALSPVSPESRVQTTTVRQTQKHIEHRSQPEQSVRPMETLIAELGCDTLRSVFFDSLKELEEWFTAGASPFQKFSQSRHSLKQYSRGHRAAKVSCVVCHDYKGGYQDGADLNPQGYFPHYQNGNRYYLQFPQLCDSFVYFSHHCVSVPPISWVESCHRQGIPCLGTVIFEGSDSSRLDRLVERQNGDFTFVKILVHLVSTFSLDGLLLNIESKFSRPDSANELVLMLSQLRGELNCIGAKLLWYDAYVGSKNAVYYVNGVNHLNYEYFDASDGFLTNYWWSKHDLEMNLSNVGKLGAGKIIVGYDVWGRGPGNIGSSKKGGFDTGKDIAVVENGSVCLFAPAWTYESLGYENFQKNDSRFWSSVAETIAFNNNSVRLLSDNGFVFYTNFSQGSGSAFFVEGEKVFDNYWVDGCLQSQTPHVALQDQSRDVFKVSLVDTDAYMGGHSLRISHNIFGKDQMSSRSLPTKLLRWRDDNDSKLLFNFNQKCVSSNIKVRSTFMNNEALTSSYFQLELVYQIVRRNRAIKTEKLKFPLVSSRSGWVTFEKTFILPNVLDQDSIHLRSLHIDHINTDMSSFPFVEDEDDWVFIPQVDHEEMDNDDDVEEDLFGDILDSDLFEERIQIGEVLVVSATSDKAHEEAYLGCSRVSRCERTKIKDAVLLSWEGELSPSDEFCDYWCVYLNGVFQSTTSVPRFMVKLSDRNSRWLDKHVFGRHSISEANVRVDAVSCTGRVTKGTEFHLG